MDEAYDERIGSCQIIRSELEVDDSQDRIRGENIQLAEGIRSFAKKVCGQRLKINDTQKL